MCLWTLDWGYFCLVLLVTDSLINVYVYSSPICFFPTISSDLLWVYSRGGWSFPGCTALGTTIGFWETLYKPCVGILCCFWWDCFGKFGCKVPKWHSNSRGDVLVFSQSDFLTIPFEAQYLLCFGFGFLLGQSC